MNGLVPISDPVTCPLNPFEDMKMKAVLIGIGVAVMICGIAFYMWAEAMRDAIGF